MAVETNVGEATGVTSMAVDEAGYPRKAGHDLASLRHDWLFTGLVAAVAVCLILSAVLMAAWGPWFALVLLAVLALAVAATIVAGVRRQTHQDILLWALAIAVGRGMPMPSAL